LDSNNIDRLKKVVEKLSAEDGNYICRVVYRDPFTDIYSILLTVYVFILGIFLLWPFDFVFSYKNNARWIKNSDGIEFLKKGQALSNSSTQDLFDRLEKGNGLTLEMWLQPENLSQAGPARIFSYSKDPWLRNFTVGQSRNNLVVRIRTTNTDLNGTKPELIVENAFNDKELKHLVIMYDFLEQRVYINGEQRVQSKVLKGNFSNWDPSCRLAIGNETIGNRPWKGKVYYAAIFNRPLTQQEVHQNYLSGPRHRTNARSPVLWRKENTKQAAFTKRGPVVRYLFDEKKGDVIHDSGVIPKPVNLSIPGYINHEIRPFLGVETDYLKSNSDILDIFINVLIFIPLGIILCGMLSTRYGITLKMSLATLLCGTLFSLGIESLQYFSMTRSSSLIDVATNMTGVAMGIVMDRCYYLFLNHQAKHLQMLLYDRKE
jgi:VanZ family protein